MLATPAFLVRLVDRACPVLRAALDSPAAKAVLLPLVDSLSPAIRKRLMFRNARLVRISFGPATRFSTFRVTVEQAARI